MQVTHESEPPPEANRAALMQHFSSEFVTSALFILIFHNLAAASKKGPKRRQFLYKNQLV
jgi:hypothetical protein